MNKISDIRMRMGSHPKHGNIEPVLRSGFGHGGEVSLVIDVNSDLGCVAAGLAFMIPSGTKELRLSFENDLYYLVDEGRGIKYPASNI